MLPIGHERFVAGGAQHSLIKVFDLRRTGQNLYYAADALSCSPQKVFHSERRVSPQFEERLLPKNKCNIERRCAFHSSVRSPRNWNVFLGPRRHARGQSLESPVYSLSRPSSISPVIYAGVQDCVMQLDIVSVLDRHPDPIYGRGPLSTEASYARPSDLAFTSTALSMAQKRDMDAAGKKWDPERQIMSLPMYEQANRVSTFSDTKTFFTTYRRPRCIRHSVSRWLERSSAELEISTGCTDAPTTCSQNVLASRKDRKL